MKKYFAILAFAFILPNFVNAQDLVDALRYSDFQINGTARSGGMGNAFGALGGDFTSVSINPAGLGLYRSSEFSFTPSFGQTRVNSNYLKSSMNDSKYNFSFDNISYVSSIASQNNNAGLVSVNIGIGYNKLKNFNSNILVGGDNAKSSILDNFASNANASNWSDFYEELAWETDLLMKDNNGIYWHDIEEDGYGQSQQKSISRQGAINEYSLAMGLNFSHKLYFGVSIGIVDLYYKESSTHSEWDKNNNIYYFNDLKFNSYLRTSGTGINGKLGIIYKPINELRLGLAVHTPTFYNLNDVFETSMKSSITYDDGKTEKYSATSPFSEYDYNLETPLRATLSGAFVIGKKGLISLDYEYVDYSKARLRKGGDGYQFVYENQDITSAYRAVGNIRLGGEYRVTDVFSLRAGFEHYPSAYNKYAFGSTQPNADVNMNIYSCGFGYRQGNFYFDAAYRYTDSKVFDMLYPAPVSNYYPTPEMASFRTLKNNVAFTFGFRF